MDSQDKEKRVQHIPEELITEDQVSVTPINKNKKTVLTLALITLLMFGFAFAMVPLYRLVCDIAGLSTISTNSGRSLAPEITQATETQNKVETTNKAITPFSIRLLTFISNP